MPYSPYMMSGSGQPPIYGYPGQPVRPPPYRPPTPIGVIGPVGRNGGQPPPWQPGDPIPPGYEPYPGAGGGGGIRPIQYPAPRPTYTLTQSAGVYSADKGGGYRPPYQIGSGGGPGSPYPFSMGNNGFSNNPLTAQYASAQQAIQDMIRPVYTPPQPSYNGGDYQSQMNAIQANLVAQGNQYSYAVPTSGSPTPGSLSTAAFGFGGRTYMTPGVSTGRGSADRWRYNPSALYGYYER